MKKGIYILPNSLTLCGTFAGFYSIVVVLGGNYVLASWAILIAVIFDGLDGWMARLTGTTTKFGIELDSLSDVIAFGVAPSVLLYKWTLSSFGRLGAAAAFLFVACGALRLARYNIQMGSEEKKHFTGMPIPGAALVVASTVLFYSEMDISHTRSFYGLFIAFLCSGLMVSTMKFHGLKEFNLSRRKPFWILVAVVLVLAVFIMHAEVTLFLIGVLYLLSGPAEVFYNLSVKEKLAPPTE
ncbi:MAG: CDP-diacylglycerol--serine O-phosphatidyltransferase [Nitrospirota bacterium]|jgi:CDP-diacylglycerol--serine O-phosphatidyltransferase